MNKTLFTVILASLTAPTHLIAHETPSVSYATSDDTYRTVYVSYPGSISEEISEDEKYKILDLLVMGEIDGTDIRFIREMAGVDFEGNPTEGKLQSLNLENAVIVEG